MLRLSRSQPPLSKSTEPVAVRTPSVIVAPAGIPEIVNPVMLSDPSVSSNADVNPSGIAVSSSLTTPNSNRSAKIPVSWAALLLLTSSAEVQVIRISPLARVVTSGFVWSPNRRVFTTNSDAWFPCESVKTWPFASKRLAMMSVSPPVLLKSSDSQTAIKPPSSKAAIEALVRNETWVSFTKMSPPEAEDPSAL